MTNDPIAETLGWLDGTVANPRNADLFPDGERSKIVRELAERWTRENRLDLLNGLAKQHGEEEVFAVIDAVVADNCRRDWGRMGREEADNSLTAFIRKLWGPLKDQGFEYTFETTGNVTTFRVTRCPIFDLARKAGAEKWLYHLVCLTDKHTSESFNPRIRFSRDHTLMQGHAYCDHRYTELSG
jgi:predicted ArsR family transcriptional regulator